MSEQASGGSQDVSQGQHVAGTSSTVDNDGVSDLNRPGPSSRDDDEIVASGDNFFVTLLDQFGSSSDTVQHQYHHALAMSATSSNPSRAKFPGVYEFRVEFNLQTSQRRNIGFSAGLNKLFLMMDSWVEVKFLTNSSLPEGMMVRLLPVYISAPDLTSPVLRCPHHAQEDDPSNINFEFVHHLIRSHRYLTSILSSNLSPVSAGCAGWLQFKPRTITW